MSGLWWSVIVFLGLYIPTVMASRDDPRSPLERVKRFLLFPRQAPTRHQFVVGLGIPADLSYESVTTGYIFKAEFFLPYESSVYRQNPYLPEYKEIPTPWNATHHVMRSLLMQPTKLRWTIYEYIENYLSNYGYNGHECLLQAICEANDNRFALHFSVAAQLIHLMLSPSSTLNADSENVKDFFEAEKLSKSGRKCEIYDCQMRILNLISNVIDASKNIL